jgi:putative peptide zinc metalloprotease protein
VTTASDGFGASTPPTAPDTGPRLAQGVELIGEFEGSGYKEPPSLVRRPDGQVIQLPDLLYRLAALCDGKRSYEQVASELSHAVQRDIGAEDIRFLADEKLRPLGVLTAADGSSPVASASDPFLGLKFRLGMLPERTSQRVGNVFRPLFLPPVVLAALVAFVAADVWLFFGHGVAQSLRQSLYSPAFFLAVFAAIVVSAAFHEFGHAAACRYGGGLPGKMGCGLYLAWPAFYTDVTDAYRLGRRARLRTDLGGVYFNVVTVLLTVGAYLVTHFEPLLLLVLVQHFEMVHQLLPIVRLDGYYIVADLTGVPDLFARIRPILTSVVPGRQPDERVTVLKPWVRVAVTAWVLGVVPLLVLELLLMLVHLPRILATAWSSADKLWSGATRAFGHGQLLAGISSLLQILVLAIPIMGILLVLLRMFRQGGTWVWNHTAGRPALRSLAVLAGVGAAAVLALAWIPSDNYRPIRPGERGTMGEALAKARQAATEPGHLADRVAGERTPGPPARHTPTTVAPSAGGTTTVVGRSSPTVGVTEPRTTARVTTTVARATTTVARVTTTAAPTATTAAPTATTAP